MSTDGARREEILEMAATMFASAGMSTTLRDIADGCGILPGSLYHHFESKEAIVVELVQRYRDDLDRIAKESLGELHEPDQAPFEDRIIALGERIASCAIRHRAAVLLTLYEPPTVASGELVDLFGQTPSNINAAMLEVLAAAQSAGAIRARLDLELLAERMCQSMLSMAVGVWHRSRLGHGLAAEKCRVFLHGVAVQPPTNTALDRSAAMRAANEAIGEWSQPSVDDKSARVLAVARVEFGRRGYEATTVRDIAKAAGISTGYVYRIFGSKDTLLLAIMESYSEQVVAGWEAVAKSGSSTIEQLDALLWVNINASDRFSEEFRIQLAWLRQSPPSSVDLGLSLGLQLRQLQRLISAGIKAGELRVEGDSAVNRARSLYELILMPDSVVKPSRTKAVHAMARDSVVRGALVRS